MIIFITIFKDQSIISLKIYNYFSAEHMSTPTELFLPFRQEQHLNYQKRPLGFLNSGAPKENKF